MQRLKTFCCFIAAIFTPGIFCLTVFVSAALIFLMEPFVGKSVLPLFGGTPAVWNTCVFFFQIMLLAGYMSVYFINRCLSSRWQFFVVAVMMLAATATLPVRVTPEGDPKLLLDQPVRSLVWMLIVSVAPAFFLLSMTAPLIQSWFAKVRPGKSPYWLYVCSNAGSFLALFAYPAVVEDLLSLDNQSRLWTYGFYIFVCLAMTCGLIVFWARARVEAEDQSLPTAAPSNSSRTRVEKAEKIRWLLCSMCPSSLMLGVTTYLSSEIAPIPFLWVLPLSAYLISFMVAFAFPTLALARWSSVGFVVLAILLAFSGKLMTEANDLSVIVHLAMLFSGCTAMHTQLARKRPDSSSLTGYYLWISVGGLCGGIINSLLAPVLFDTLFEYPLAIAAGFLLVAWPFSAFDSSHVFQAAVRLLIAILVLFGIAGHKHYSDSQFRTIYQKRTFFGVFTIHVRIDSPTHYLSHGSILHGMQRVGGDARSRRPALTYYYWSGPAGDIFIAYRRTAVTQSVGVVGLGVGSLAGYGDPGQDYTFYEIDPAIEQVANNPRWFTYLEDARARGVRVKVELGDARLRLADAADGTYGILVLDAFTSDAIPVHLLTKEAISMYLSKVSGTGLLAFHISNKYVDLEPVLANIASDLGCVAFIRADDDVGPEELGFGKRRSTWLVISRTEEALNPLLAKGKWTVAETKGSVGIWTDVRSNLLRVMRK